MSLPVFRASPLPAIGPFRLGGPAGRHAAVVRRLRPGEQLQLVDGAGGLAEAVVTGAGREHLDVEISAVRAEPAPTPRLVVVQALAKGDRGELAVELLTEVGADELVPWAAARSIVRWEGEKAIRGRERWQRVADAAAEQSRRHWWPAVAALADTGAVARRAASLAGTGGLPLILHEGAADGLADLPPATGELLLIVGPEGGLAADEIEQLTAAGALPVRLGREVLRTSTAGLAAAAALLSRTQRWALRPG